MFAQTAMEWQYHLDGGPFHRIGHKRCFGNGVWGYNGGAITGTTGNSGFAAAGTGGLLFFLSMTQADTFFLQLDQHEVLH